ncbi:hypothetical protein D9M73_109990 [compost metagenome]
MSSSDSSSASGGILSSRSIIAATRPQSRVDPAEQVPDRIGNRLVVRIDQALAPLAMAREMDLADAIDGDASQILIGVEAVIGSAHIDVVHIEEEIAAGPFGHLGKERPFGHLVIGKGQVGRWIFENERPFEHVLNMADVGADRIERLFGERQGQKVVRIDMLDPRPTEMVGHLNRHSA